MYIFGCLSARQYKNNQDNKEKEKTKRVGVRCQGGG